MFDKKFLAFVAPAPADFTKLRPTLLTALAALDNLPVDNVGAFGFIISGTYLETNLPLSVGFLNIPAFLIFFPITTFMARLGAKASHRVDKKKMTKYFGLFLIIIGSRFLYEYFSY